MIPPRCYKYTLSITVCHYQRITVLVMVKNMKKGLANLRQPLHIVWRNYNWLRLQHSWCGERCADARLRRVKHVNEQAGVGDVDALDELSSVNVELVDAVGVLIV